MKYLVLIVALAAAGYYYLERTRAQSNAEALALVIAESKRQGEVDLFDLKAALTKHVYAICDNNSTMLLETDRTVGDCEDLHDNKHMQCDEAVFRLAPLTITDSDELIDYAKRYVRCALPYEDLTYQPIK
ncbi:hypothetical protein [Pseudoalteromonas sp. T1lg75]|uniref:hypothetical protein n=1 Tax=Pseudoalteromonas sp. T1lg75 TaxID=2077102 RepID=UPI000CF63F7B|nr:hypothetical protein [Pseudoalteromonas sp. T1lg75]